MVEGLELLAPMGVVRGGIPVDDEKDARGERKKQKLSGTPKKKPPIVQVGVWNGNTRKNKEKGTI